MALVFSDGFDLYNGYNNTSRGLNSRWTIGATSGQAITTTGRFGGQALRCISGNSFAWAYCDFDSAVSSGTFGCAIRCSAGDDSDNRLALQGTGGENHIQLRFNTDGSITLVYPGGSTSSSTGVWSVDTWYSLEIEFVINDTTGSVDVYLDTTSPIISVSNVDTKSGTSTGVGRIRVGKISGTVTGITDVDDAYCTDSATKPTYPIRIETLRPNADGATLDWSPSSGSDHYAVIDDTLADASDYISASAVNDVDEIALGALSETPYEVLGIQAIFFADKSDATAREFAPGIKVNSTTSDGSNQTLSTSIAGFRRIVDEDPDASAAWDETSIGALELRPKVTV